MQQALDEDQPGSKVLYKKLFEEDREYNQGPEQAASSVLHCPCCMACWHAAWMSALCGMTKHGRLVLADSNDHLLHCSQMLQTSRALLSYSDVLSFTGLAAAMMLLVKLSHWCVTGRRVR